MALPSGLAGQVGYDIEGTYGTADTVTRFLPLVSETLIPEIKRLESAGIIAGRRTMASTQWKPGEHVVAGGVQHEMTDNSIGILLNAAFGGLGTTGPVSGDYTHTFTPGALPSLTTQIGKPDVGGTVRAFTFDGCMVTAMQIAAQRGQIATLGVDMVAQDYTTATALASATYGSADTLLAFIDGSLTLGGSAIGVCSGFTFNVDNGLKVDRHDIGSTVISKPLEEKHRKYSGVITAEFESLTTLNRYLNGTEAALVLGLVSAGQGLTITMNVRLDHAGPQVAGTDVITVGFPFTAIGSTDAAACTAVLVNNDATPT